MSGFLLVLLATAAVQQTPLEVTARRQQWVAETLWCGIGDVVVKYQDITLRASTMEVDLTTLKLTAEGNVVFDQGPNRLICQRLEFDLKQKTGKFFQVEGFFSPTYRFRGLLVEKLDEARYRFRDGVFTSCELDGRSPPWSIVVGDAIVELEGYGHFRHVALRVKNVPVFYTPRLLWPVMRDRAAGFLVPNVGYNDRRGAYLGNAFFWPVSRSFDTTFFLDTYSKGYVGLGQELRWAPADNASGEVQVNYYRDPDTKRWEWKLTGKHRQLLPGGWAVKADLLDLSNLDFFQKFERTFDPNALRRLASFLSVTRTVGNQTFGFRLDHQKTFFQFGSRSSTVVLERQPQVEYRLRPKQLGVTPFYLSTVIESSHFRINRSATLRGKYSRLDIFPQISLLTPGLPWLSVTPTLGVRGTYYSSTYTEDRRALGDEDFFRRYGTAGLALTGPSFSRVFVYGNRKIKHLLEPRLDYTYVSDPGPQQRVPLFDERDGVAVSNRLRWILANRLFVKTGEATRELASLELSQDYSFSQPLTVRFNPSQQSQRGPFSLALHINPTDNLLLDARAGYDAITSKLSSVSFAGIARSSKGYLNLTYASSYQPQTGETITSQLQLFLGLANPNSPWRWQSMVAYDVKNTNLLRQEHTASYRGSCWAVSLQLRDYRIPPHQIRDYRIIFDLTGIGTLLDIRGGLDAFGK